MGATSSFLRRRRIVVLILDSRIPEISASAPGRSTPLPGFADDRVGSAHTQSSPLDKGQEELCRLRVIDSVAPVHEEPLQGYSEKSAPAVGNQSRRTARGVHCHVPANRSQFSGVHSHVTEPTLRSPRVIRCRDSSEYSIGCKRQNAERLRSVLRSSSS